MSFKSENPDGLIIFDDCGIPISGNKLPKFNVLPNNVNVLIPTINLTPTDEEELAVRSTKIYMRNNPGRNDAILIPYYNTTERIFRFHNLPLHAVNWILALICEALTALSERELTCDVYSLCCLGGSEFSQVVPINVKQYYSTIPQDNVTLHSGTQFPQNIMTAIEKLLRLQTPT